MIFSNIIKLKEYAQLSGDHNFNLLIPTLRIAESDVLIPYFGNELYKVLTDAINNAAKEEDIEDRFKDLLHYARMAVAPMLCYLYASKSDAGLYATGLKRSESETNKSAYQYQGTEFKEANLRESEKAVELMLSFLEEKSANYDEWTQSNTYKDYRSLFIKTGTDFSNLFPSASPFRNYWAFRPKIKEIELTLIRPELGDELYTRLKGKDQSLSPEFTELEAGLVFRLKKAIAHYAVAFSIPFIQFRIEVSGITVTSQTYNGSNDSQAARMGASNAGIQWLIDNCKGTGEIWLKETISFIKDNKTEFTEWKGFTDPVKAKAGNESFTTVFGVI